MTFDTALLVLAHIVTYKASKSRHIISAVSQVNVIVPFYWRSSPFFSFPVGPYSPAPSAPKIGSAHITYFLPMGPAGLMIEK